jgi:hypothetical protein
MILQEVVVGRVVLAELVGLVVLVDRGGLADPENPEELVGLVEQADQANRAALTALAVAKPASLGWK